MWRWFSKRSSKTVVGQGQTTTYQRRDVLKLGAIAGVSVPVILTLASKEARAAGSWRSLNPNDARAQGSWKGGANDRVMDRHMNAIDAPDIERRSSATGGFQFPGSYQWREQRDADRAQRRRIRGEFSRFGNGGD